MSKFAVGETVVVCSDLADPNSMREYVITKLGCNDLIECGSSENTFHSAYCWPIRVKADLLLLVQERAKLKKAYDDSMASFYVLINKIARGEV